MAESSDPSDHAVPKDASGWAQVNIFGGWYKVANTDLPWRGSSGQKCFISSAGPMALMA